MRKSVFILFALLAVAGVSACAKAPATHVNAPETQRSHAEGAQEELSSEVRK